MTGTIIVIICLLVIAWGLLYLGSKFLYRFGIKSKHWPDDIKDEDQERIQVFLARLAEKTDTPVEEMQQLPWHIDLYDGVWKLVLAYDEAKCQLVLWLTSKPANGFAFCFETARERRFWGVRNLRVFAEKINGAKNHNDQTAELKSLFPDGF